GPRTSLATFTHMVKPTAMNTCQKPFPNAKVIAKTSNKVGMLQIIFVSHMIILSILPRKYPANEPSNTPMEREMITVINPTLKLTLVPMMILLKMSRPNLSVPNQNFFVAVNDAGSLFIANVFSSSTPSSINFKATIESLLIMRQLLIVINSNSSTAPYNR